LFDLLEAQQVEQKAVGRQRNLFFFFFFSVKQLICCMF
jgi:hypothetical protein